MITFVSGVSQYIATPFSINGTQMLAVYWTDVDTTPEGSGTVWYRETANATLLHCFHDEITVAFPYQRIFNPIYKSFHCYMGSCGLLLPEV